MDQRGPPTNEGATRRGRTLIEPSAPAHLVDGAKPVRRGQLPLRYVDVEEIVLVDGNLDVGARARGRAGPVAGEPSVHGAAVVQMGIFFGRELVEGGLDRAGVLVGEDDKLLGRHGRLVLPRRLGWRCRLPLRNLQSSTGAS